MLNTRPPSKASSRAVGRQRPGERGAVLVQVAIAMVGLIAFNALVVDYGILWLARRQAQNAADAGAMAGAIRLAFVDFNDQPGARTWAVDTAKLNFVWGEEPDVLDTDVDFPTCPPGSPGEGTDGACIRVNVYRNQRVNGKPIPTIFGNLFNVAEQGVKASATAQVVAANSTECLRPWAIVDRWDELGDDYPIGAAEDDWNFSVGFEDPPDLYVPPNPGDPNDPDDDNPGTGFTVEDDYGTQFAIKMPPPGQEGDIISSGWFRSIDIPRLDNTNYGAAAHNANILGCGGVPTGYAPYGQDCPEDIGNDDIIYWAQRGCYRVQTGNLGSQRLAIEELISRDSGAVWTGGTSGGITGSAFDPGESPRIVPIGIMDIADYLAQDPTGNNGVVKMVNILGFFIEGMGSIENGQISMADTQGPEQSVIGRLMTIPGDMLDTGGQVDPESAFMLTIMLVR
jgi:hypothetical protein